MKVLQINAVYGHGSTGTIVRDIEQLCEQNDIECYVASPDPKVREAKRGYVIGNALDHKLHALLCRINGMQGYFSHIPTLNLCKYLKRVKPDIVHLHNLHSNYIHINSLLDYLAKKEISTIVTLHDCWFYTGGCFHYTSNGCNKWQTQCGKCPRRYIDTPAYFCDSSKRVLEDRIKYLNAISDLTITGVSKWITDEASKSLLKARRLSTIHNGVNIDTFQPRESSYRERLRLNDKFIILGPGSKWLSSVNKDFLYSFSRLLKSDEILLLYGVSSVSQSLPQNVRTVGFINDRQDLASLYSCADVFANVSREDSLSLINIEAQACGTPVVTFSSTGLTDTVDERLDLLVPIGNPIKMYERIQRLRASDLKEISLKCRDYITNHFDEKIVYKSYIDLYEDLILNRSLS